MTAGAGSSTNHVELETTVTVGGGGETGSIVFEGAGATTVSHTAGTTGNPDKITITSADTQVTSVANHYTPSGGTAVNASGGSAPSTSTVQVVTGITKDAAGHVTGITSGAVMQNAMNSLSYSNADGTALHTVAAGDGFEISAATDFGSAVSMEFDPVVTVGNGTTQDIHFVGGKATLPVYTKAQTDTAITTALGAANAMVIKGELGQANSALPTANVEAGDTYIVTYANGLTINGQTCEAGDLFVAKQDAATSTSSNWYYVPAGNDLAYFDASAAGEGIALKTKADNITSGELKFATVSTGTAGITAEVEVATTGTFNTATVNLAMQWGEF